MFFPDVYHEVTLKFSTGFARVAINKILNRYFVLSPRVDSISPTSGSAKGGTTLTIQVY